MKKKKSKKIWLSLLTVVLSLSFLVVPYKAQNGIFFNTRNQTWSQIYYHIVENFDTGNPSYTSICGSFDGLYDGVATITFDAGGDPVSQIMTYRFYPINCHIDSYTNTSITLSFQGTNYIELIIQEQVGFQYATGITCLSVSSSMTKIDNSEAAMLHQCAERLYNIYENSVYEKLYLTRIANGLLGNSELGTTGMAGDLYGCYYTLQAMDYKLGQIEDILENIDNAIDTVTWSPSITYKGYSSSLSGTYTIPTSQTNIPANTFITFGTINFNALQTRYNPIYRIVLPINANTVDYDLIISNTSNEQTNRNNSIIMENRSRSNLTIYFMLEAPYTNWAQNNVSVKVKGSTTLYTNYTPTLQYIGSDDIEYWSILSYIAIRNNNVSILNTTVNDTINNITDYNTEMTKISNIEQTYINNFNEYNENITQIIDENKGIPTGIDYAAGFLDMQFENLLQIAEIKYLFILLITCVIVSALLG